MCPAVVEVVVQTRPRVYKEKRVMCRCGQEMAATNLSRHRRKAWPYGEAGPGSGSWKEEKGEEEKGE